MNIPKILIIAIALGVGGCAPGPEGSDIYGYEYTDVTPMGIMYRVDSGGAPLNAGMIDFLFAATINCAMVSVDPTDVLIVSTDADVNPNINSSVEGWAWPNSSKIAINISTRPEYLGAILPHEIVHLLAKSGSHDSSLFSRCGGANQYNQPGL